MGTNLSMFIQFTHTDMDASGHLLVQIERQKIVNNNKIMGRNVIILMLGEVFVGWNMFLVEPNSDVYKSISYHSSSLGTPTSRYLDLLLLFAQH